MKKNTKQNTRGSYKNDCEEVVSAGMRRDRLGVFVCFLPKTFQRAKIRVGFWKNRSVDHLLCKAGFRLITSYWLNPIFLVTLQEGAGLSLWLQTLKGSRDPTLSQYGKITKVVNINLSQAKPCAFHVSSVLIPLSAYLHPFHPRHEPWWCRGMMLRCFGLNTSTGWENHLAFLCLLTPGHVDKICHYSHTFCCPYHLYINS